MYIFYVAKFVTFKDKLLLRLSQNVKCRIYVKALYFTDRDWQLRNFILHYLDFTEYFKDFH